MNHLATLQTCAETPRERKQRVLENPVTGERITFLTMGNETEGRVQQYRLELPPGFSEAKHLHPYQQKCLKVTSGKLRVWVNELEHVLLPNEDLVILPGVAHTWKNDSDGEVSVVVTLRPALNSEELLKAQVTLAKEGKTNERGMPKALHYAAFAQTFENEILFIENPLQWTLRSVLAAFSQWLGYQTFYRPYRKSALSAKRRRTIAP